ncbi:putative deleted in malignant brain tumors 1 protein isoform X1 [Apostichopus japonicus]|uniref:Putative deleted in malignant brain tumors 1 protein isoform X1 n=1 Tax=Stichopus japonicus TaxID=307972 RepID=A0A2G8KZL2_STIJA|nr:putative deleted in malignant brain tumors 1 protein isoform X1 [Apostichopus japonicus]
MVVTTTGEWKSTIMNNGEQLCDDTWELQDANVVCRQLGFLSAVAARGSAYYGQGTGPILLDGVGCVGDETRLEYCYNEGWYMHNCVHWEDAGVECLTEYGRVRLADGSVPTEGRVEIFYNNEWGTICDDHWQREDAEVICRQLGYSDVDEFYDQSYFGEGYGPIMEQMNCDGDEAHWQQCHILGGTHLTVDTMKTWVVVYHVSIGIEWDVRLRNGYSINSGRVEVYHLGEWGICDDYWSSEDAAVICRQLGYSGVDTYFNGVLLVKDLGQYWGILVATEQNESPIEGSLRLVDGVSIYSGRIEIYHYGEWGTVCDDDWEEDDAQVACRQLGYPTVDSYGGSANYGEGSGPIMLDDVRCDGSEYMLTQCGHNGWYQHDCEHGEDAWVNCQIPVTYYPRLVAGNNWYEGRVEVWDGSRWERLCNENFYEDEASTVCKQIGFFRL